jgi:hypothetical protein
VAPATGAAIVIERVVPPDPPASSVVATVQEKTGEQADLR